MPGSSRRPRSWRAGLDTLHLDCDPRKELLRTRDAIDGRLVDPDGTDGGDDTASAVLRVRKDGVNL
jgi:hypothetical protein